HGSGPVLYRKSPSSPTSPWYAPTTTASDFRNAPKSKYGLLISACRHYSRVSVAVQFCRTRVGEPTDMSGENVTGTRTAAIAVFGHKPSNHSVMVASPIKISTPSESILHFCIVISSRVAVSISNDIEAAEVGLDRRAGVEVKTRV